MLIYVPQVNDIGYNTSVRYPDNLRHTGSTRCSHDIGQLLLYAVLCLLSQ